MFLSLPKEHFRRRVITSCIYVIIKCIMLVCFAEVSRIGCLEHAENLLGCRSSCPKSLSISRDGAKDRLSLIHSRAEDTTEITSQL